MTCPCCKKSNCCNTTPGPRGEAGPPGAQGPIGPQGQIGPAGEDGEDGEDGAQGLPGEDGAQGLPGEQGPPGQAGEQGGKGDTGDTGPQGDDGQDGFTPSITCSLISPSQLQIVTVNASGTETKVIDVGSSSSAGVGILSCTQDAQGSVTVVFELKDGSVSSKVIPAGGQGPQGDVGPQGEQGPPGVDGADGQDGEQGPPGVDGADGQDGEQGPPGVDGADGQDGAQGPPGVDGQDGFTPTIACVQNPDGSLTFTIVNATGTTEKTVTAGDGNSIVITPTDSGQGLDLSIDDQVTQIQPYPFYVSVPDINTSTLPDSVCLVHNCADGKKYCKQEDADGVYWLA